MKFKKYLAFVILLLFVGCSQSENPVVMKQMQIDVEELKSEVHRLNVELGIVDEKINHEQTQTAALKDTVQSKQAFSLSQMQDLQVRDDKFDGEIDQLRKHANDTTSAMAGYRSKIFELEKELQRLNSNLAHSKRAIESLVGTLSPEGKIHHVVRGDSLDKIARKYGTSVRKIKEINNLENDLIVVGQKVKLP